MHHETINKPYPTAAPSSTHHATRPLLLLPSSPHQNNNRSQSPIQTSHAPNIITQRHRMLTQTRDHTHLLQESRLIPSQKSSNPTREATTPLRKTQDHQSHHNHRRRRHISPPGTNSKYRSRPNIIQGACPASLPHRQHQPFTQTAMRDSQEGK